MSNRELAAAVLGSRAGQFVSRRSGQFAGRRSPGGSGSVRILAYHRVLDADPDNFAFDEGVISASTEGFCHQMDFVRRNFDVLSFKEICDLETAGKSLPRRSLIITFDDGYRDNYTQAFPVLKQMGLPATIFLATGHIGQSRLFWWDTIAYCVKHARRKAVNLECVSSSPIDLATPDGRRDAITAILRWVKQAPDEMKHRFLDGLSRELDAELPDGLAGGMHLSWDEVRQMADSGIEFGSHTVTHPILTNVDAATLDRELIESKKTIEQQLDRDCIALAYPVGGRGKFDESVKEAARRAGYRYGLSYDEGVAALRDSDRYALPRIHVESDQTLNLFRAGLMFPGLMFRG
jgi:peptidoglycan/xylan/chitin deacetylase (PgdA/CDA1 family)